MIPLFKVFMSEDAPARVGETLMSGYIGEGPRVQEFEVAFGKLVGTPYEPLALNSCTSALDLALHLCGVGPGDEVISTPMTCTATNGQVVTRGAKLVWADVDPMTGLIRPIDVAQKITRKTRAIIAVDWAGRSCDYDELRKHAWNSVGHIPVIQDAAHNLFVDMKHRGDYVCWSFQAIKHLTTGDGGAFLPPRHMMTRARLLRWYGLDRLSSSDFRCAQNIREAGYKYHMNDIAASVGLANLPHTAWVVEQHRKNAAWYAESLRDAPGIMLNPPPDPDASWWLYTLLVNDRAEFIAYLAERGVAASPVHRRNDEHTAFAFYNGRLPGVDYFADHEVAIPVGWWLSEQDRAHVAETVLAWCKSRQPAMAAV